ncbi:hypothetical protein SAMN05421878_10699, partial [Actinobaculum suis]
RPQTPSKNTRQLHLTLQHKHHPHVHFPGVGPVGVVRGNQFFLKQALTTGVADNFFAYGNSKDVSAVGDWDGDGIDTPAVDRR